MNGFALIGRNIQPHPGCGTPSQSTDLWGKNAIINILQQEKGKNGETYEFSTLIHLNGNWEYKSEYKNFRENF